MTFKPLAMLEMFKDGVKVAEEDITKYTEKELKLLLEIQDMLGRAYGYKLLKEEEEKCLE